MKISSRTSITPFPQVRNSLIREAKRLTDLWEAQVEDLDSQIAGAISNLQKRQTEDLAAEFDAIEQQYEGRKPKFSSSLLELSAQEPRMCKARAFSEALKVGKFFRQF